MSDSNHSNEASLQSIERPGDALSGANLSDLRNISALSNVQLQRLLEFKEGTAVLTRPELSRLETVLGVRAGILYNKQKFYLLDTDMTVVRHNLLTEPGYSGYCGNHQCFYSMPRTVFNGAQFSCKCGWVSGFTSTFIEHYKSNKQFMN